MTSMVRCSSEARITSKGEWLVLLVNPWNASMKSNVWRSLMSNVLEKSEDNWIMPILERRESVRERN